MAVSTQAAARSRSAATRRRPVLSRRPVLGRPALTRAAVLAGLVAFAVFAVAVFGRRHDFADLTAYHGALTWWSDGGDLYQFAPDGAGPRFTHAPFAALLMLPITAVPPTVAGWFAAAASLAALSLVLAALLGRVCARYGWPRRYAVACALALALATEPVRETFGLGQLSLLILGLIVADLVGLRRQAATEGSRQQPDSRRRTGSWWRALWVGGGWAGVGIGLATAVKVTPVLFIGYLLLTGQRRAARTAIATALVATAAGFALAWDESLGYFAGALWRPDRVGAADLTVNQSLGGMLARLYDAPGLPVLLWLAFSLLLLAVGLSRARRAHDEGDELAAFTLVGATLCVVSPNSWTYQLVFALPALVILVDGAARRRDASRGPAWRDAVAPPALAAVRQPVWFPHFTGARHAAAALVGYVLLVVAPIWAFSRDAGAHYADGVLGVLGENSLAIATIVLVAALPWRPGAESVLPPWRRRVAGR